MSATDYSQWSIEDLIQHFIDEANHIGCPLVLGGPKVPYPSVEYTQARDMLRAIAAELRVRKPLTQLRTRLFENVSPDVRGWAGTQFYSVDPEWADASATGVLFALTTHEVLAWRHRILQRTSRKFDLQEATVTQLVDRFVDACERCYGTTRFLTDEESGGTSRTAFNRVSGDIYAAAKELNRRGELQALVPLLNHPLITVRQRAACFCLPIAEKQAVATLDKVVATKESPEFTSASWTLDLWRNGEYCPFPDDLKRVRI
jgi:hypothetical protein